MDAVDAYLAQCIKNSIIRQRAPAENRERLLETARRSQNSLAHELLSSLEQAFWKEERTHTRLLPGAMFYSFQLRAD